MKRSVAAEYLLKYNNTLIYIYLYKENNAVWLDPSTTKIKIKWKLLDSVKV